MKKIFAIAAAAATVMTAGSALAADRLSDTEMDTVSAGLLNFQFASIRQANLNASPSTAVAVGIGGAAVAGATTNTTQVNTGVVTQGQLSGV